VNRCDSICYSINKFHNSIWKRFKIMVLLLAYWIFKPSVK